MSYLYVHMMAAEMERELTIIAAQRARRWELPEPGLRATLAALAAWLQGLGGRWLGRAGAPAGSTPAGEAGTLRCARRARPAAVREVRTIPVPRRPRFRVCLVRNMRGRLRGLRAGR